jgi:preprotein translocase subunit SecD
MSEIEEKLRGSLSSAATAVPVSPHPLADYQNRAAGRRDRGRGNRGMRLGLSLAAVAAAVTLIVVGAIALGSGGSGHPQPAGSQKPQHEAITLSPSHRLTPAAMAASVEILRVRIDALGVAGISIESDHGNVVVDAPTRVLRQLAPLTTTRGILRFRRALSMARAPSRVRLSTDPRAPRQSTTLGQSPTLTKAFERRFARWNCNDEPTPGGDLAANYIIACDGQGMKYLLAPAAVDGSELSDVTDAMDSTGNWVVNLDFDGSGAAAWQSVTATAAAVNGGLPQTTPCRPPKGCNSIAIVLDGRVKSAPYISVAGGIAGGQAEISGSFTQQSATELATVLKNRPLPASFREVKVQPSGAGR